MYCAIPYRSNFVLHIMMVVECLHSLAEVDMERVLIFWPHFR
jgi:hypothetical protein